VINRELPVLAALPSPPDLGSLPALVKVLGDEHRLAMVALLARGELCVCHLVNILGLPQSTVSHHVGILKRAGLVRERRDERDGRWTHYRLDPAATSGLHQGLARLLALTDLPAEAAERPSPPCP
jgi:ArsR family transcriptional regulator